MWLIASIAALASQTGPDRPLSEVAATSPLVFEGRVVEQWSVWIEHYVVTMSRTKVRRTGKGAVESGEILLATLGGPDPDIAPSWSVSVAADIVRLQVGDRVLAFAEVVNGGTVTRARLFERGQFGHREARRLARTLGGGETFAGWDAAADPPPPPPVVPGYLVVDARRDGLPVEVHVLADHPGRPPRGGVQTVALPPGTWTVVVDPHGDAVVLAPLEIVSGETLTRRVDLPSRSR